MTRHRKATKVGLVGPGLTLSLTLTLDSREGAQEGQEGEADRLGRDATWHVAVVLGSLVGLVWPGICTPQLAMTGCPIIGASWADGLSVQDKQACLMLSPPL